MVHHTHRLFAVCLSLTTMPVLADQLATNMANPTGGSEIAAGVTRLTAAFTTDGSSHTLSKVQLLLAGSGVAQVSLHQDAGLEPGPMIATLTSPAAYPNTLQAVDFTATGITLNPSAKYWIVLDAISGSFTWGWTITSAGQGVGYSKEWGYSADDGAFWWTQDRFPLQMTVLVDEICTADCDQSGSLNIDDFVCFQTLFALGDPAADCDGNGSLTIDDFICYQTLFAVGC